MSMTDDDDDRELARLLSDPSLWIELDPAVEDRVLDLVAYEQRAELGRPASPRATARLRRRHILPSHAVATLVGAAAATLVAVLVTRSPGDDDSDVEESTVELRGAAVAEGAVGSAEVSTEQSGVRIRLTLPGLPRREGDDFYEGWLTSCDGTRMVPIGTFHDMDRAAAWAGVSVEDYPLLSITAEHAAGPHDPEQSSSGEMVASAVISPCPGR